MGILPLFQLGIRGVNIPKNHQKSYFFYQEK